MEKYLQYMNNYSLAIFADLPCFLMLKLTFFSSTEKSSAILINYAWANLFYIVFTEHVADLRPDL